MGPFPELPSPSAARDVLKVLAAFAAAGALIFAVWFFVVRPEGALRDAAEARTGEIVAQSQADAAQDTVRIVVDHQHAVDTITHRTEVTNEEILSAPGASQSVDPDGYDAFVRALCLQDGRHDPVCADVLHRDGDSIGAR